MILHELSFNISFYETIVGKPLVRLRTALEEFSVKIMLKWYKYCLYKSSYYV